MDKKTLLTAILSGILLISTFVFFKNNVKLKDENKNLQIQNDSLMSKINKNPPIKEDNVTLYIYEESFLELIKTHPDCAKQYSEIMSKYE